eukprot:TRINITY_DN3894_c1_g1_i4.p1 TRINITY_DN3894_c1_g1~~TRINITY_DN3894_c1_g1_i4.p1  ORF type:complete len:117 (-),score=13.47 TRINITY_DN3894_c1_g1_i4:38-388(-)
MGLIWYAGKFGNAAPGTKSMACWISRNGGSSIGSSSGTRSANFFRRGSTSWGTNILGDSYGTCVAFKAYITPCSLLSSSNFRIVKIGSAGAISDVDDEDSAGNGINLILHPFQLKV